MAHTPTPPPHDPVRDPAAPAHTTAPPPRDHRTEDAGERAVKILLAVLGIILLLLLLAWAIGLIRFNVQGTFEAPRVAVEGGSTPDVNVETGRVVVGTTQETVDVPTVRTEERTIDVPVVGVERP